MRPIALLLLFALSTVAGFAQAQPEIICDATCGPDPSAAGYSATVAARPKLLNARGTATIAPERRMADGVTTAMAGSQSYNYAAPILRLPGRAGLDLNLTLYYNSRVWTIDTANGTATFNADRDYPGYGFRLGFGYIEQGDDGLGNLFYVLTESDGSKRLLNPSGTANIFRTEDSSYIDYNNLTKILRFKNGAQVRYQAFPSSTVLFRPDRVMDTNGNFISIGYVPQKDQSISTITDTLGRVITFSYDAGGRLISIAQGAKTHATFTWNTAYVLKYNFAGLSVTPTSPLNNSTQNVLTGVTYANGAGVNFVYGDWGIVNTVETRSFTGSARLSVSYDYPPATTALSDHPTYTRQTVNDGVRTSVYNFEVTKISTGVVASSKITDPAGNSTITNLITTGQFAGLASSVEARNNSGATLRTISNTWAADGAGINLRPSQVDTVLGDTGQTSRVKFQYDANGNATSLQEYDFGLALKRETATTYLPPTSNHILNLPASIQVKDGAGAIIARTDLDYSTPPAATVTGAANHDDAYSAPRANVTSVTRYTNAAGTGPVTRTFSFDSLGNLITAQLDCCNQKQWAFSATTQYAYPDSVTTGPAGTQLTASAAYNFASGTVATSTDENGQVTSYAYDIMDRQVTVTQPDGVQFLASYDDASAQPSVTNSNSANSARQVITFDGSGRETQRQLLNGAALVSAVTTNVDLAANQVQTSNPFGAGETPVFTLTQLDALGRPLTVTPPGNTGGYSYAYLGNAVTVTDPAGKTRRSISDALGRLVQVDEPGAATAATAGSGSVTVNGTEQSVTSGGTRSTGSVTISGGSQSKKVFDSECSCFITVVNTTTISVTINGFTKSTSSGTTAGYATNLASAFNGDAASPVTAVASASTVTFTSKLTGASVNYSMSVTESWNDLYFTSPNFVGTASGATMTGGTNPNPTTYDSGTVSITVNGLTKSASYGQGSASASVASALAAAINGDAASVVTAAASGSIVNLTAKTAGAGGNYSLSAASSTSQPATFASPSFTTAPSGATLSGGANAAGPSLANPYSTLYAYDALDHLAQVSQGAQVRRYSYNGLGQLTAAATPESGSVSYTYTGTGQVATRADARGIVTMNSYDGLNRLQTVSYSDGTPAVTFTYGGAGAAGFAAGRLLQMADGSGTESYAYDRLGQVTQVVKAVDGVSYTTAYGYNAAGQTSAITYPSGRVVTRGYDALGRLGQIASGGTNYLTVAADGYNAAGQALGFSYGNGVSASLGYNPQLQLSTLRYSKGAAELLNLSYSYNDGNGRNNGRIQGVSDNTGGATNAARSTSYTYDEWARLSAAQTNDLTAANTWKLAWGYDRYGNRLNQSLTGGTAAVTAPQLTIDPATNRISMAGFAYDASGNLTNDGLHSYSYDAENRIRTLDGVAAGYAYDGNGLRVKRSGTVYIYSGGKVIAEYVNGSLSREYIYSGQLLATIAGGVATYHYPDHLSNRVETDGAGAVTATRGHLPYGETWYETGTASKWKFTSYERDAESNLDYAIFRYDSSRLGRFMTPDLLAGNIGDPQSLNRYAYVGNDPINFVDPLGLTPCSLDANGNFEGGCTDQYGLDSSGGNCTLDGFSIGCGLVNGNPGVTACPGNDCSIFNRSVTGNFGGNFSLVAAANGLIWFNNLNGEEISNSAAEEVGLFAGGWPATSRDNFGITGLRLIPESDYCDGGDRYIDYRVVQFRNGIRGGTDVPWYVTEHQSLASVSERNGISTDVEHVGRFGDHISGAGQRARNTIQSFTVSTSLIPANSIPILVRYGGRDYGSLGIWLGRPPLINGNRNSIVDNGKPNGCR